MQYSFAPLNSHIIDALEAPAFSTARTTNGSTPQESQLLLGLCWRNGQCQPRNIRRLNHHRQLRQPKLPQRIHHEERLALRLHGPPLRIPCAIDRNDVLPLGHEIKFELAVIHRHLAIEARVIDTSQPYCTRIDAMSIRTSLDGSCYRMQPLYRDRDIDSTLFLSHP